MDSDRTLTPADVAAVAQATAELLSKSSGARFVDAQAVALHLSVSIDFVYSHQDALGAFRIGTGPKPKLRFDLREIDARMLELRDGRQAGPDRRRSRQRRSANGSDDLLPIKSLPGSRAGRSRP